MIFPWERQPRETDKAWAAFQIHRDTQPAERSLRNTHEQYCRRVLGQEPTSAGIRSIGRWSSEYNWSWRVQAWDVEVDRRAQEAFIRARIEAATRQGQMGKAVSGLMFNEIVERSKLKDENGNMIGFRKESISSLVNSLKLGIDIERTSMGEPIHIEAMTVGEAKISNAPSPGLDDMTKEELRAYAALARKAAGGEQPKLTDAGY